MSGARGRVERPAPSSRRRALVGALVGLLVIAAGYVGVTRVRGRGGPELARDLIAVMPFQVRGAPSRAYLGEDMVDLMSTKLDGVGPLTVVNPRAVIAAVNRRHSDLGDPTETLRVARELGAGRS